MNASLVLSASFLVGCWINPAQSSPPKDQAHDPRSLTGIVDLFPSPKEGLSIKISAGEPLKLDALLEDFARVTGQNLLIGKDTRAILAASSTGLSRSVEVPAQEVYTFVESLLMHSDFAISPVTDREPRLLAVYSLNGQEAQRRRGDVVYVPSDRIELCSRHPAVLVQTVVDLPNTDVRTLSNSMRTLFTDANTQQIIPVGNSNSLILVGFGSHIASIVRTLLAIDQVARNDMETRPKVEPQPKSQKAQEAPAAQEGEKKPH